MARKVNINTKTVPGQITGFSSLNEMHEFENVNNLHFGPEELDKLIKKMTS